MNIITYSDCLYYVTYVVSASVIKLFIVNIKFLSFYN